MASSFKKMRAVLVSEFTGFVWTKGRFVKNSMRFKKYRIPLDVSKKKDNIVNEVFAANCRRRYESSVPLSLVLFTRVYIIYSVHSQ